MTAVVVLLAIVSAIAVGLTISLLWWDRRSSQRLLDEAARTSRAEVDGWAASALAREHDRSDEEAFRACQEHHGGVR